MKTLKELVADFRTSIDKKIDAEANKQHEITITQSNFFSSKEVTIKPWEKTNGLYPNVKTDNPAHDTLRGMHNVAVVGEQIAQKYEQSSSKARFLWKARTSIPKMTSAFNQVNKETWMPDIAKNTDGSVNDNSYELCKQFTAMLNHVRANASDYFSELGPKEIGRLQVTISNMQIVGERSMENAKPSFDNEPRKSTKIGM